VIRQVCRSDIPEGRGTEGARVENRLSWPLHKLVKSECNLRLPEEAAPRVSPTIERKYRALASRLTFSTHPRASQQRPAICPAAACAGIAGRQAKSRLNRRLADDHRELRNISRTFQRTYVRAWNAARAACRNLRSTVLLWAWRRAFVVKTTGLRPDRSGQSVRLKISKARSSHFSRFPAVIHSK
jgi:hypothetical protein